jgi:hypothetical protein
LYPEHIKNNNKSNHPVLKTGKRGWEPACNPSYSEGRDQEDHSSKSAQAKSETLPQKISITKENMGRVGMKEDGGGGEFKYNTFDIL